MFKSTYKFVPCALLFTVSVSCRSTAEHGALNKGGFVHGWKITS